MGNVVFVEVLPVVGCLQPELSESFPLRVRAHDAICADEASESNTIEALGIENGSGIANTLSKIYETSVKSF
jgi:hypothetical protein